MSYHKQQKISLCCRWNGSIVHFLIGTVEWVAMQLWEFSGTAQYHKYFQLCENMDSYVVLGMNINFMFISEHKKRWLTLQECAIAWMAMTV